MSKGNYVFPVDAFILNEKILDEHAGVMTVAVVSAACKQNQYRTVTQVLNFSVRKHSSVAAERNALVFTPMKQDKQRQFCLLIVDVVFELRGNI